MRSPRWRALPSVCREPSVLLLTAQLLAAGSAFVVNVLAARALDPSGRGELALLLQVAYLATLLLLAGTDRSVVTTCSGATASTALRTQLRLLAVPVAVCAALLLLAPLAPWPPAWRGGVAAATAFALVNAVARGVRTVSIASGRLTDHLRVTAATQALLLLAAGALFASGTRDVTAWVWCYVAAAALPAGACCLVWLRGGQRQAEDPAAQGRRHGAARREGLVLLPSSLAHSGMLRLDRLVLAGLGSTAALGVYASIATMTELLAWPVQAYADSRLGRWREAHERGELRLRRVVAVVAAGTVLGGALLAAAAAAVLVPLLGDGYASARSLVVPLTAAAGVFGVAQLLVTALVAQARAATASAVEVSGFVVSAVSYALLIPPLGALGAAYGSLAGYGATLAAAAVALARPAVLGRGAALRRQRRAALRRLVAERAPRPTASAPGAPGGVRRTALVAPSLVVLLVAVAGRYTLDRSGLEWMGGVDLRLVAVPVALALVVHVARRLPVPGLPRRPEGWLVAACVFFAYQAASGLWAPAGARVGSVLVDIAATAALTVGSYLAARRHPHASARAVLWCLWGVACVFALGALAAGPGVQGRYAAFGGGPNVFVRIEVLGVVATAGLVASGARRWVLAAVPLLVVGAVLSGSRGGLLAGVVVAVLWAVTGGARSARAVAAGCAAALAASVVAYLVLPPFTALVDTRFIEQTAVGGYTSARPAIWASALGMVEDAPLLGVGIDGFHALAGAAAGVEHPHAYVLAVLAEGGAVGVVLLGVAVLTWVGTVRRGLPWSPTTRAVVAAAGYVALASTTSGDYYDARLAWCFAALAAALVAPVPRRRPLPPPQRSAGPASPDPVETRSR